MEIEEEVKVNAVNGKSKLGKPGKSALKVFCKALLDEVLAAGRYWEPVFSLQADQA